MFYGLRKSGWKMARCESGGLALVFAFTLPFALAAVGVGIDYGMWLNQRGEMQAAADAAALAGAKVYSETQNSAAASVEANGVISAHNLADASPSAAPGGSGYRVTLSKAGTKYFAGIVPLDPPVISVSAVASVDTGPGPCILTLDPRAGHSLWIDSNSRITAIGCKVHANATSAQALYAYSNSQITADEICVVGGYGGSTSHYTPNPNTGCAPVSDPLFSLAPPTTSGCNFNNVELDDAVTSINPGIYCGGLTIKGNSNVTFNPGIYVIKNGKFFVDSNSRVTGNGVAFYLTGTDATIHFTSNVIVDFIAPTTGPQAGVIFFEDRSAPLNREHYFDSNNISRLEGAIYLSRGVLWSDSNTQIAATSAFTTIVVNRLRLDSNAELVINANYGASGVPSLVGAVAGAMRLIE